MSNNDITKTTRNHHRLAAIAGALGFAVALLGAGCQPPPKDDDDEGSQEQPVTEPPAASACDLACDKLYDCGVCIASDGECVTREECKSGCAQQGWQAAAVCVNSVVGCDQTAFEQCINPEPEPTCSEASSVCGDGLDPCCSDSTCVDYGSGNVYCGYNCSSGSECASGCCAPLESGGSVCAPEEFCG